MAGFLFQKLLQLIQSNSDLIGAVSRVDDPGKILRNIDTLKTFILERSEESDHDDIAEVLVYKIRHLVSGAENDIESFIIYASQYKRGRFPTRLPDTVAASALKVREAVKNIETMTEMVQKFYQNKKELDIESLKIQLPDRSPTTNSASMPEEDKVIGFDHVLRQVIQLLTRGSKQLEVISIIGKAGLGKTTLAKMVLNHPEIEYEFFIRSFVSVSQEYSRRGVFLNIIGDFSEITDEMIRMTENELAQLVLNYLEKTNCLIVLDDVLDQKAWDDLSVAFPNNSKRCRVLVTSQNDAAAWDANPRIHPFHMCFLDPKESRELLRREVFGDINCPADFEGHELQILQNCSGTPLLVLLAAGILLNRRDEINWWKAVAELVNNRIAKDPKHSSLEMVNLSFSQLPSRLKPCFLYLGTFPEYFKIPVRKLIRLWIAEGFVQQDENLMLEDIAYDYLEDLIHRNLVMVERKSSDGQIKTCHVHPMVREFCKKQGAKENFFKEIKRSETYLPLSNCDRLCTNSYLLDYVSTRSSSKSILSFLGFDKETYSMPPDLISSFAKSFRIIRVLDVRPISFPRFPLELLDLNRLKYLAISGHFKVLPKNLSHLIYLQTLIVETSFHALEIEANILKMVQLRHLHTNASTHLKDIEEEPFTNASLQTLSLISPDTCKKRILERTPGLKKLGVCGKLGTVLDANGEGSLWLDSISMMGIQNLKLLNDDSTSRLNVFPCENKFPSKLTKLTLSNTMLNWRHMVTLGKLENLEVLKLKDNAFLGELWMTEDGGFCRLKVLHIGATNLIVWRASAGHFPMLTSLFLRHCTQLEAIPGSFAEIPSFKKIDLHCTNYSVALSARKIQLVKLILLKQQNTENCGFKLSVYPPDM